MKKWVSGRVSGSNSRKIVFAICALALMVVLPFSAYGADKLLVKDSGGTNTVFSVDDTGKLIAKRIGVGNSSPLSTMHLTEENVNFDRGLTVGQHFSSASAGTIQIKRSRGTAAAPSPVINGDNIVGFHGQVFDGSSYIVPVSIIYQVDGAVSTGSVPSAMIFKTGTINPSPERIRITSAGKVGIGTNSPSQLLDINSNGIRIRTSRTPSTSSEACNQGEMAWDTDYVYVCVATNSWKRAALTAW